MNHDAAKTRWWLGVLVVLSFLVFATAVVLRIGIEFSPFQATDSAGRQMGWNDPLSAEHFEIIVRNFRLRGFLKPDYIYDWVLLTAHAVGMGLLMTPKRASAQLMERFFACQVFIFPMGIPAALLCSEIGLQFSLSQMKRKIFIIEPFISIVSQPVWVLISIVIFFLLRAHRARARSEQAAEA